jgi:serine/threonine protein kinase
MATVYGGRWRNSGPLDEGGQARVFRVKDLQDSGKEYALKLLKNRDRIGRFRNEVAAITKLSHPGIVRLIDHQIDAETAWYVMELFEAGSLEARVAGYRGGIVRSLDLLVEVSRAVQCAHEAKIIHRDLKPANVLFRDDAPVVCDFGISFDWEAERQTSTSEAVGPRYFIAPELEGGRSDEIGPHNDIYSLGKLLYYALTGGVTLPRERHRKREYDLRNMLTDGHVATVESCQLEYVNRLLDHMLAERVTERWSEVGGCITMMQLVGRLVKEGRYPITDHMPCRFCGMDGLPSLDDLRRDTNGRTTMYCRECGYVESFMFDSLKRLADEQSIFGPPADWKPNPFAGVRR